MNRLTFSTAARADLADITVFIADDDPERALTFVAELEAKAAAIAERPESFPTRDDVAPGLRAATHGRYLLFYRVLAAEVRVIRVLHSARDLPRAIKA